MITNVIALVWPQLAAQKKYEFKTPDFFTGRHAAQGEGVCRGVRAALRWSVVARAPFDEHRYAAYSVCN